MTADTNGKLSRNVQLVRAGPSETFHDLEVGHDTIAPGIKPRAGSRNELRRLTSLRKVITSGEFWESLPLLSKAFLVASCIDALLVIAFSIQQMASVSSHRSYARSIVEHHKLLDMCCQELLALELTLMPLAEN